MQTNDNGAVGHRLAVDFGTSNTVAVLRCPDAPPRPLLFDGSPLLPSVVCLGADGDLLVGRDAVQQALATPSCCEPTPKRLVAEEHVLLGRRNVPVVDLVAAVLLRVRAEAVETAGTAPEELVMTHPDGWGEARRGVLARAAEQVDLPRPHFLPEPAAAANLFPTLRGADVAVPGPRHSPAEDRTVLIYDFGGGTFDVSVLRWTADDTPVILRSEGLSAVGGKDLDARIVDHLGAGLTAGDATGWDRLRHSQDEDGRRARWQLWEGVRDAKERLSRLHRVEIHIPVLDTRVTLTRTEFERLARPVIARTVTLTVATLNSAGVTPARLAGVYLVGGSSRIPLVATMLHHALHVEPRQLRQPELAVAEGAALALVAPSPAATVADSAAAVPPQPAVPAAPATPRPLGRRRVLAVAAAAVVASAAGAAALVMSGRPGRLVVASGADGSAAGTRQDLIDQWNARNEDFPAEIRTIPGNANAQHSAMWNDSTSDVFNLDVPRVSSFANEGLIIALPQDAVNAGRFLDRPLRTCRWQGRYWALPFNTDVGLLFRRSHLPQPTGWQDLTTLARAAHRPVYSGQFTADESAVVNLLEAVLAVNPLLLPDDGSMPPVISTKAWNDALDPLREALAAGAVADADAVRPPDLASTEDLSVRHATAGQVDFVRLWPAFAGKLDGMIPGPLFGPPILGGQNLAVSSKSRNPGKAVELIRFLTDDRRQQKLLRDHTYAPTTKAAYATVAAADREWADLISSSVERAHPRPISQSYSDIAEVLVKSLRRAALDGTRLSDEFELDLLRAWHRVPLRTR